VTEAQAWDDDGEGRSVAIGMVLEAGRGSLPFSLVHGEPLVSCAALALQEARVECLDADTAWTDVVDRLQDRREVLVLHDALCPLAPPAFLAGCVRRARGGDTVVAAWRPVTDTVKVVREGLVGATVDRSTLRALTSPVVLPPRVAAGLGGPPGQDLPALVGRLVDAGEVVDWVEAPSQARRVADRDDLRLLEVLTTPVR
jgi:2-C-methyl-D-erythritol 4-phosphate cytidylyltransferase